MKSGSNPSFYFSAYPLKAIADTSAKPASTQQSPYLKAILSGKTRGSSRMRVFPMVNPYPRISALKAPKTNPGPTMQVRKAKNVEGSEKEWYNNYE